MSVCPSSEQRKGQLQRSQQIPGTQTINATNPEGRTALVLLGLDAQGEEVLLLEIKELADDKRRVSVCGLAGAGCEISTRKGVLFIPSSALILLSFASLMWWTVKAHCFGFSHWISRKF